ncbi:lasso peptide biosynthesis B2 protein [Streptomyces carpaticus]|uniref:lasso peptide biosynthesis B2 protein n=1 Tax=Streptomyces carpaticus TaxID=285558 RepID=UPI0031F926D3
MSFPMALPPRIRLRPAQYLRARTAALVAARASSSTAALERAVRRAHRGARRPSTLAETDHAVAAVTTANIRLGGTTACLRRSVAALLYCLAARHTPVLVIGVRPGTASVHAWLEAEGQPAGEPTDPHLTYTPVVRYIWEHTSP